MNCRNLVLVVFLMLAVCACKPRLIIVHTNDTHSHFEPLRGGELDGRGGVIERAAFLDSLRNAEGEDRVLLLHAGDFSQGTSYFSVLGGRLEMDVINDMHYDVMTLGNHEFDNGIEALTERVKMLRDTKIVCANLDLSPFELGEYVKPCCVVERGGMRIGVIGLETDLTKVVSKLVSSRIPTLDNAVEVNRWADYLRDTEKCDMVVLLSHLGYEDDKALVPQIRGVDLVIGGHSHTCVEDIVYVRDSRFRKVGIVTDWKWGLELGLVRVY